MVARPRLLDLFCGAGGAGYGYSLAGFDVVGVDLAPQPRYPFPFVQADALEYLDAGGAAGFDAVHASPPCQGYSSGARAEDVKATPRMIEPVRARLQALGVPYVIENVVGARAGGSRPDGELWSGLLLCGSMFGLGIRRHRLFESSAYLWGLPHECQPLEPVGRWRNRARSVTGHVRYAGCLDDWREWMGMPWAETAREVTEAIPPAYTEYIGAQLGALLEAIA